VSNSRIVIAILLAAFLATSASGAGPVPMPEQGLTPYLTPQRVAHPEKGRTINFVCLGQGSPTVILSAGLGGWSWWWWGIQGPLAKQTRVCGWDRAGYGFSGPSPEPQDIVHTTQDLERALKKARISGPYVMVGHSMGAYESLRFTDLHRESVVGMVLVDPDIPDRVAVDERVAPQFAAVSRIFQDQNVKQRQDCAAELRSGTLKSGTPQFERCTATSVPALFPDLQAAIAQLNADPARLLTQASLEAEHANGNSGRQVVNAKRDYGDMPLVVLTAGLNEELTLRSLSTLPPGTPGAGTPEELARLRQQIGRFLRDGWGPAHRAYAALSTRGRDQLVPDATHNMVVEKPDVVISAINEVMNASRHRVRK
jgi:pimeloyl-ACP methyl ester carboxylesterase